MSHAIISTVGTSVLTGGAPRDLAGFLRDTANLSEAEYTREDLERVRQQETVARERLRSADAEQARALSAELNGIVRLGALGPQTCHYLLYTDTLQGRLAANLVADWLRQQGCSVVPQVLEGLSTRNQEAFARGIDYLLNWCDTTLRELQQQGWRITFNLVGGFKSLQAYAQTLGMFYADEMVYIFEGKGAELIRIPRLPVALDRGALERHAAAVARMAAGEILARGAMPDLPEAYLDIDQHGQATLSLWGSLAWKQHWKELLSGPLLEQPGLEATDGFRQDYKRCRDADQRAALQEALAKASVLWREGGLARLKSDGGLLYEEYKDRKPLGHFRVSQGQRVSCEPVGPTLRLRHFGSHNYVNKNP